MFRDHQDPYLNGVLVRGGLDSNHLLDTMSQESIPEELVTPAASRK
ncbi:unnamed protein product [Prunus brigantina]